MKGINVKKIAAFAGAAVLFGAAAVAAEVMYGNTQLVDQNGQPTVKIYVGSKAAVSDGVAAANIAAKIANEAYKSSTLTATTSGAATCSVGSGTSTTGSCSIVESSKKVTLQVDVPGTIAGTHTFKTLITDSVDRALQNRVYTGSDDTYAALTTSTDTAGSITSPLRAVLEGDMIARGLYRIGSDKFTGFADYAMTDNQATSTSYTEEQSFWVGAGDKKVAYDSDSSIRDVIVSEYSAMAYSVKFTGNDYGVPVCTGDLNANTTDNWASCTADSNSRTEKHRLSFKFMGSEWIVSSMTNPSGPLASGTKVIAGGEVKLAKEAKYGIVNVGGQLDAGNFKIRLSDISVATGAGNEHPAIIDVLDANDAVVGQIQVNPGTTYTFTQSGTGNSVKIHVYKTAPGFTLNAKWAEMAVYTDEITLKNAGRYNLVSSTDTDKNFKVSLLWKNKDYTGGTGNADTTPDTLREIVVYNTDGLTGNKVKVGDVVNFLKSTPTFKMTYSGVDLTDDDYLPVTFNALSSTDLRIATTSGASAQCADTVSGDAKYSAKLVEIATNGEQKLGGTGDALDGDYLFEKIRFDPAGNYSLNNATGTGGIFTGTLQNSSVGMLYQNFSATTSPVVFYQIAGKDCYNWDVLTYNSNASYVKFDTAGDNSAAQGRFYFSNTNPGSLTGFSGSINLIEDAGKYNTTSNVGVVSYIPFLTNKTASLYTTVRFKTESTSTQQMVYTGIFASSSYEPTLVTERGSKILSVGTTDASMKVAKKVGMPTFQFAFADTVSASASDEYILGVGDSKVFGGVTVKVKAIDASSGSCSVVGSGGQPACSVDVTGVSALIQPNNAASVEVTEPFKMNSKMVYTDADSVSSSVAILVGGPEVNMMTKDALVNSAVDFNVETVVVKELGTSGKIVVAGKSAADTTAAAEQFIAGIKRQ